MADTTADPARIVIVGSGYVGLYAALRLRWQLRWRMGGTATITVIDARSYMTYQSFLPEVAAGSIEPRHVVVPLRPVLRGCSILTGRAVGVDPDTRSVTVEVPDGHTEKVGYDVLVLAPGSVTRTLPVPGLAEVGIGFKTLAEALYLRNHVLACLDAASSTLDPELRRRLLTFVFVGGGYAGVEAMAELQDMTRFAARRYYPGVDEQELRWVLVEAADRIMPEVSGALADYTVEQLRSAGVDVRLSTRLSSAEDGLVRLDDGAEFGSETIVWTAGVRPDPLAPAAGLPTDRQGRVECSATLQVAGHPNIFAAGDSAAVPDLAASDPDATCAPTAQHAIRQGKHIGTNVVAYLRGTSPKNYRHRSVGSVATLGLYRGVAELYGRKVRGFPAWAIHRLYHLARMPTAHQRGRILTDWLLGVPFRRQVVALGETHEPRAEFARVARR